MATRPGHGLASTEGLPAALDAAGDEPITVRPADVVRALAQVARRTGPAAA
ncbi:hypothetical protein [Micromonospora inyonensis]|uniref:hypothetical protein n=1 Tax=Micromonospora inyonensis TaxID=47866 RepID=UPI00159EF81E|nr:hypothetical protein [Micromonospora inyonensis]